MMMPEVNGLSACCAIKTNETTKEIPIVVFTAAGYDPGKKLSEDLWAPTAT